MNNQVLYKLSVLGAIFSFLPFFGLIPFVCRVCGNQVSGAMQLCKGMDGQMMSFIRGG